MSCGEGTGTRHVWGRRQSRRLSHAGGLPAGARGWLAHRPVYYFSDAESDRRESSISSTLYPTTRDVNRFSSMPYRSCHCLDPPKNHDLDYRASKALGTALSVVLLPSSASWITSIMLLSIAFKRIWRRLFANCSVPFTKRSLNSFV